MQTREKILERSKQEFLEKGFAKASLRSIAKQVGLTTGAIYGYFPSKDALFSSLVEEVVQDFLNLQDLGHAKYLDFSAEAKQAQDPLADILAFVDYIYEHFTVFKLLICCSRGSSYEDFFPQLLKRQIKASESFLQQMELDGREDLGLDQDFVEIVSNSYVSAIFEIVRREMPKERAKAYVSQLSLYYGAGWQAILAPDSFNGA